MRRSCSSLDNKPESRSAGQERSAVTIRVERDTGRIRDVLRRLDDRHPALAHHLTASVTTGMSCRYLPAEPVEWET